MERVGSSKRSLKMNKKPTSTYYELEEIESNIRNWELFITSGYLKVAKSSLFSIKKL